MTDGWAKAGYIFTYCVSLNYYQLSIFIQINLLKSTNLALRIRQLPILCHLKSLQKVHLSQYLYDCPHIISYFTLALISYFYKQSHTNTTIHHLIIHRMPKRQIDSDSSRSDHQHSRKQRLKRGPSDDEEPTKERTRSREHLRYQDQKDQPMKKVKQIKDELTIDSKYMIETKTQKQEPKAALKRQAKSVKMQESQNLIKQETKIKEQTRKKQGMGQIPLKMTKHNSVKNQRHLKILDEADQDAQALVQLMTKALEYDRKSIQKGKIACQRIRVLEIIKDKIRNLVVKRKFIQKGGLQQMCVWMLRIADKKGRLRQPCIAVKMGLLRIVHDMSLDSLQIKQYGCGLWQILQKNKQQTKIPQLKNLCSQILTLWDYTTLSRLASKQYVD